MKRTFLSAFVLITVILFTLTINITEAQTKIPENFCISQEEVKLYNAINDYRKALNLPKVPLSKSLSFVAQQHITDLLKNKPDTNACSFHSWSDKGSWTACCYGGSVKDKKCMQEKPRELTNYNGKGYEIVYWENKDATADNAFDQWRTVSASRSLITNFKEWEDFSWKAMGVAIEKNFAIVWFGEEMDPETETKICGSGKVVMNKPPKQPVDTLIVSNATGRYYLIFGSFQTMVDAKRQVQKYRSEGFKNAKVISKDNKFRISLTDYANQESAQSAKKDLPAKYKDAWIMPF
jgi:hypothetical protein